MSVKNEGFNVISSSCATNYYTKVFLLSILCIFFGGFVSKLTEIAAWQKIFIFIDIDRFNPGNSNHTQSSLAIPIHFKNVTNSFKL